MSSRDELENQKLDRRFKELLYKLRPHLLHQTDSNVSLLCRLWLERLNCADDQRNLRNNYLLEFYKQLTNGGLKSPFNKPPEDGKLIPISKCHRLVSSSCNDLSETSPSGYETKRNRSKPRSKSLRRDNARSNKTLPRYFDVHSNSPNRSSHADNSVVASPNVHFCEQDNRNLIRTYRERIEALGTIVKELENQNEKLREKLMYYSSASDQISNLHERIKQLLAEIASLRSKLTEVQEIKSFLEKHHQDIVDQYKIKMTEQFKKMKRQLENERLEKQDLNEKIALIEQKLENLNRENKQTVKSDDKEWQQKFENMKMEYENILQEKEMEIKRKEEIVQQKEIELAQKISEIDSLSEKVKELQQFADMKSQDDSKLESMLVDQYKTIKDELSKIRNHIVIDSRKQSENHQEISALKKKYSKFDKLTQKQLQENERKMYHFLKEKEREIINLQTLLKDRFITPMALSCSEKPREIGGDFVFESKYNELLDDLLYTAKCQRCKVEEKLSFVKDQMHRLQKN